MAKKSVLLVDDAALFRRAAALVVGEMLPEVEVHSAANGALALAVLETHRVDLLVTDLAMPTLGGTGLLASVLRRGRPLPVIVLTATTTPDFVAWAKRTNAEGILSKPVVFPALGASRPYVLLEATWPLGWQGYLSSVRNYAVTVTGNVGINDPSTEDATALSEYLSSIMPPGRANSLTERDGSLSPQARQGYPVFERVCAGCHAGPLGTSRRRIDKSIGDGKVADIPALVGVYRQGVFFRDGSAKTLDAAVEQMVTFAKESLDTAELAALKRYVAEMTSRELFATSASPQPGAPLALDGSLVVTFSYPIYANDENVDKVRLFAVDDAGTARRLLAKATVDGRRVTLAPVDRLPPASKLRLTIEAGLEAEDGRLVATSTTTEYRTASVATLALDGRYTLTYTPVAFGPPGTPVAPLTATMVANKGPSGSSDIEVSFPSKQIRFTTKAVVSGTRLHVPPIPLAVSGAFADGFSGFEADLLDTNGDGIADGVAGGTGPAGARGYTMSGPGFEAPSLAWDLVRLP